MSEGSGPTKAKKKKEKLFFYVKDMKYILTFNV